MASNNELALAMRQMAVQLENLAKASESKELEALEASEASKLLKQELKDLEEAHEQSEARLRAEIKAQDLCRKRLEDQVERLKGLVVAGPGPGSEDWHQKENRSRDGNGKVSPWSISPREVELLKDENAKLRTMVTQLGQLSRRQAEKIKEHEKLLRLCAKKALKKSESRKEAAALALRRRRFSGPHVAAVADADADADADARGWQLNKKPAPVEVELIEEDDDQDEQGIQSNTHRREDDKGRRRSKTQDRADEDSEGDDAEAPTAMPASAVSAATTATTTATAAAAAAAKKRRSAITAATTAGPEPEPAAKSSGKKKSSDNTPRQHLEDRNANKQKFLVVASQGGRNSQKKRRSSLSSFANIPGLRLFRRRRIVETLPSDASQVHEHPKCQPVADDQAEKEEEEEEEEGEEGEEGQDQGPTHAASASVRQDIVLYDEVDSSPERRGYGGRSKDVPPPPPLPLGYVRAAAPLAQLDNFDGDGDVVGGRKRLPPCRCVVRGKDARMALQAFDCEQCRSFHQATGVVPKAPLGRKRGAHAGPQTSRHRMQYAPVGTPPGFWDLSFPRDAA